jgi:hypothetical protein
MREFLPYCSWPFTGNWYKIQFLKYLLNILIYLCGFQSVVGGPFLWLAWAPSHLSSPANIIQFYVYC